MKYQKYFALIILGIGVVVACKKTEVPSDVTQESSSSPMAPGLPGDFRKINGYLYASGSSSQNGSFFAGYAIFGDTARDLMSNFDHYEQHSRNNANMATNPNRGNVNVGGITFSGYNFFQSASSTAWAYSYSSQNFGGSLYTTNWKVGGNKSFKPQDVYVTRGFPVINDTVIPSNGPSTLTISKGYSLSTQPTQLSNYDSLLVIITVVQTPTMSIKKVFVPGKAVSFSKQELDTFKTHENNYANVFVKGYNYSNQTVAGKKYVYELSRELIGTRLLFIKKQ